MKILLMLVGMVCAPMVAAAQVSFVGTYSNIKYTTEHESGFEVSLWKCDGKMYGFLTAANGMQGDVPVGVIDHVLYDVTTGKLTFQAKLTTGYLDNEGKVPAKDLFTFDGVLTAKLLSGKLKHEDAADPNDKPTTVVVSLRVQKDRPDPDHYATLTELLAANQSMLDNSGPRW